MVASALSMGSGAYLAAKSEREIYEAEIAAIVCLIAHFAVGAAKSLITIRSWWSSGFEMTWIGAIEGVVTYAIGIALGRIGQ